MLNKFYVSNSILIYRADYIKVLWVRYRDRNAVMFRIATAGEKKTNEYFKKGVFEKAEEAIFQGLDALTDKIAKQQPLGSNNAGQGHQVTYLYLKASLLSGKHIVTFLLQWLKIKDWTTL